nr:unnamed protein product [Naegleria fowleri]
MSAQDVSSLRVKLDRLMEGKKHSQSSLKVVVFLYRNRENHALLFRDEKEEEQVLSKAFNGLNDNTVHHPLPYHTLPDVLYKRYQGLRQYASRHPDMFSSTVNLRKNFSQFSYQVVESSTIPKTIDDRGNDVVDIYEEYLEDEDTWISDEITFHEHEQNQQMNKSIETNSFPLLEDPILKEYSEFLDEDFNVPTSIAEEKNTIESNNHKYENDEDEFLDEKEIIASLETESTNSGVSTRLTTKKDEKNVIASEEEEGSSEFQIFTISPEDFNGNFDDDDYVDFGNVAMRMQENTDSANDNFVEQHTEQSQNRVTAELPSEYKSSESNAISGSTQSIMMPTDSSSPENEHPMEILDSPKDHSEIAFITDGTAVANNFNGVVFDDTQIEAKNETTEQPSIENTPFITDTSLLNENSQEWTDFQEGYPENQEENLLSSSNSLVGLAIRKHKKRSSRKKKMSIIENNKEVKTSEHTDSSTIINNENDLGGNDEKEVALDTLDVSSSIHLTNNEEVSVQLSSLEEFLQEDATMITELAAVKSSNFNTALFSQTHQPYLETSPARQNTSQDTPTVPYVQRNEKPSSNERLLAYPSGWEEPFKFLHTEKPLLAHPLLDKLRRTVIDMISTALTQTNTSPSRENITTNAMIVIDRTSSFMKPLIHSIYAILLNRPKSTLFKGERDLCGIFSKLPCLKKDNVMQEFLSFKEVRILQDQKKLKERDLLLIEYLLQKKMLAYCTFELVSTSTLLSESYEVTSLLHDNEYARPFFALLNLLKKHVIFELRFEFDEAAKNAAEDYELVTTLQRNTKTLLHYIVEVGKSENLSVEIVTDESKNHNMGRVVRTLIIHTLKTILSDKLVSETKWLSSGNFVSHPWQLIVVCAQGPLSKVGVNLKTGYSFQNIVLTIDSLVKRKNQTKIQLMDDKFFSFVIYCLNYQILFEAMKFIFKNIVILEKHFMPQSVILNIQAQEKILSCLQSLSKIRFTLNFY